MNSFLWYKSTLKFQHNELNSVYIINSGKNGNMIIFLWLKGKKIEKKNTVHWIDSLSSIDRNELK